MSNTACGNLLISRISPHKVTTSIPISQRRKLWLGVYKLAQIWMADHWWRPGGSPNKPDFKAYASPTTPRHGFSVTPVWPKGSWGVILNGGGTNGLQVKSVHVLSSALKSHYSLNLRDPTHQLEFLALQKFSPFRSYLNCLSAVGKESQKKANIKTYNKQHHSHPTSNTTTGVMCSSSTVHSEIYY